MAKGLPAQQAKTAAGNPDLSHDITRPRPDFLASVWTNRLAGPIQCLRAAQFSDMDPTKLLITPEAVGVTVTILFAPANKPLRGKIWSETSVGSALPVNAGKLRPRCVGLFDQTGNRILIGRTELCFTTSTRVR